MAMIDSKKREESTTNARVPASPSDSSTGGLRRKRRRRTAVVGSDTRSVLTDTSLNPFFYIGQIIYPNFGGKCTGTIVAPRSIVTAGHCLHKKGEWSFPSAFAPGRYNQGESIKTRTDPYGVWVADRYVVTQTWLDSETWDSDLGVVTFTNNFFQNGEGPAISIPTPTTSESWWLQESEIVGYPSEWGQRNPPLRRLLRLYELISLTHILLF